MSFTHKDISSNLYFILLLIISIGISLQVVIYKIGIILLFLYWIFFHHGLRKIKRLTGFRSMEQKSGIIWKKQFIKKFLNSVSI